MPDTQKVPFGQSLSAKAAAVALAVSGALLLAIALAGILPEKTSDWKNTLPAPGMDAHNAQATFVRARYLHEASVRPRLIKAGFYVPGEAAIAATRHHRADDAMLSSQALTEALWTLRAFPTIHDALLTMLLDQETALTTRANKFYTLAGFLACAADALSDAPHRVCSAREHARGIIRPGRCAHWFAAVNDDPRLRPGAAEGTPSLQSIRDYEDRLFLAREILPVMLRERDREITAATNSAGVAEAGADDHVRCSAAVLQAMRTVWAQRDHPSFLPLAKELLSTNVGTLTERCEALPLLTQKPGLPVTEYLFWNKHAQAFDALEACVGTAPRSYAYLLGCLDTLMAETQHQMKERGSFVLGGQTGPGVTMTRTAAFTPAKNRVGNLYLLADMDLAMQDAPAYDLARAYPIFWGSLYRHLKHQPLLLPLNPEDPKDAAVLDWYADTGWSLGRTILFSAVGTPAEVAEHWASVHLFQWTDQDTDPDIAFLHPVSGHFMAGLLPRLKGDGVTRFLGPVTAMWFGRRVVDATGWVEELYEARPESAPSPTIGRASSIRSPLWDWASGNPEPKGTALPVSQTTAVIVLGEEIREALAEAYGQHYTIELARHIDATQADLSPLEVFQFVDNTVDTLAEWGITADTEVRTAIGYLWQFRDDTKRVQRIRTILAQTELCPYERIRKVRRVLGLPEKED